MNILIVAIASLIMYVSPLTTHIDPIIIIGYYIVYLELAKLLVIAATGADAPILIRYMFAAITVGAAVKVYEAMIYFEITKMLVFSLISLLFLLLRWLAIYSTREDRNGLGKKPDR